MKTYTAVLVEYLDSDTRFTRTVDDIEADSIEDARYIAEQIALPTEEILSVKPN